MAKYIIKSYAGFNNITFGMKRDIVRSKLGDYKEFRKTKYSKNTSDDFGEFHIFYDEMNCVEAVEIFAGEVFKDDILLFPNNSQHLQTALKDIDASATFDESSLISNKIGISAYVVDENVESILVFRKGYYD
jgi:hypothetical protein